MRNGTVIVGGMAAVMLAASCSTTPVDPGPGPKPPIDPPVTNCNVTPPTTPVTPALLASGLPCDATIVSPITLPNLQHGFDYYSWLTFLALNAPAGGGVIGQGGQPGGDAPTQWEQWKELSDLMKPGGAAPGPWDAPRTIPPACLALGANKGSRVLSMVGKTPDVLSATVQPFDTGPLIDQHGRYARYEILVNRPMFEYIVQNGLYSKQGQSAFTATVDFPSGTVTSGSDGTVGAIMVKAAWMVLGDGDDASRFHTARAFVYTAPQQNPRIEESCTTATLGLVGLHVAHKTAGAPQWIWSTFEHAANAPEQAAVDTGKLLPRYNFYRDGCSGCAVNEPPPRPWNPNAQPFPNGFTSQIVRVTPITAATVALTDAFTGLLAGTVWQNYLLVSTQWPTDPQSKTDPNGVPAPMYLANSTLETYIQGTVPQASSSCTNCHGNAAATTGRTSDFTFVLERAQ
ncbi:hypothetical protein [Tahibacter caeni]|uniref:hypothetical protein n=1 Tax=Tahibacter caeni TaxID=1453545 RepID=UPI002147BAB6|nr:hypothetical protein [Tahibacter caeni]